jgi:hypothetical protein
MCQVYGQRASVTVDARYEHNGWPAGSKQVTKYANDGMTAFSATASGFVPKNVVVGAIVESGAIQSGCDGT